MSNLIRKEQLDELRRQMGTLPDDAPELDTPFYRGVQGIEVKLITGTSNPYKAMYDMATATWGKRIDKWGGASVEAREAVVRAVLSGEALPLALEAPQYTFAVENLSRWAFDQLARARIGIVFASMGTRDNSHLDIGFRFHESTWRDPEKLAAAKKACLTAKDAYALIVGKGQGSWQEAREVLPISCLHRFAFSANYAALRNLCARRMSFSEAEDVVAVAWLLRHVLMTDPQGAPLLGAFLRPGCDFRRACGYHKAYSFSEAFGCLFKACGRNPVRGFGPGEEYEYATFNETCSDRETIASQLGISIPTAEAERPEHFQLTPRDLELFRAE